MKKTNGSFHDVESSMTASWTGSHFRIYNHACLCQIESFHLSDNSLEERFLVTPRFDITHKYAYVEHNGLVNMKVGLIRFAKQTVKEEIDDALSHIKPSYDSDKMSAAWEIEHFITAIYFSIFYMNTNSQIYRKCANPSCECYFKVETTNNRKKYCSAECANATAQRRHRAKRTPK